MPSSNGIIALDTTENVAMDDTRPTDDDILCGQGAHFAHHPGNLNFTRLIEENFNEYRELRESNRQYEMWRLRGAVLRGVRGRFLRRDNGVWTTLSMKEINRKIIQRFKDMYRGTQRGNRAQQQRRALAVRPFDEDQSRADQNDHGGGYE